ncbi:MAG: Gfo/Idh/MocA family oxidoreductase [Devosia sp.]|uniref:Gfo/Idh/MocA family protein n=1 Tax=Devosia sp. TaxID=1871048 RepID=UPI0026351FFC|nr:Gfo/Idh/MocA family oxidoreductase [Devosia sp.]MDB5529737.1 Gfo/Idh/MocA family oxidoreductase [Devosia sp.]
MTNPKRLGLGIVGAGMGAKPHALALQALTAEIDVRGVYRRNAAELQTFCDAYGFPTAASYEALLADPEIQAILVLTPPNAREDIVAAAAQAGKHVLLEKPVERTIAAAERIVASCAEAGVTLGVIFQHRFRAASKALAASIAADAFGPLRAVHLTVPWWRPQTGYYDQKGRGTLAQDGGGVLITQAIHSLDLMLSLCGPITEVTAMAVTTGLHQMETEDFVSAGLLFANGAVGALVATTANYPGGPEMLVLNFDRASATLTAGALTISWMDGRIEEIGEPGEGGGGADPMAFPFAWHKAQIADFAEAIRAGRQPLSTGVSALRVHRLIDALMESARQGTRIRPADES